MLAQLHQYTPPVWASSLKNIPQHYVKLAQRNSPIHSWHIPNLPEEFSLSIKRDDLTGSTLTGNKVRKLEFLLADAINKKCDTVLACGGFTSNHCRATAVAARQLGLNCYLMQWGKNSEQGIDIGCKGNVLLSRMVGSHIIAVPKDYSVIKERMEKIGEMLRQKDATPYVIEFGGSTYTGMFGYLTAFEEMISQNLLEDFDDIVMAAGTGGTCSGIAIANYLTGSKLKCHGFCVSENVSAARIYSKINEDLSAGGFDVRAEDIIDIIGGCHGEGYGISSQEELENIIEISSTTGILLDPVYNIKAVRGMLKEMTNNPGRFKGRRILYIHTGGLFGLYDGRMEPLFATSKSVESTNQVLWWGDINDPIPF